MSGFTNDVMNAENVNFSGIDPTEGQITQNGQLQIGAAVFPFIRPNVPTSMDGSISITPGPGSLDFSAVAQGFQPNAVLQEFDDFISSVGSGSEGSKLNWQRSNGSYQQENGTVTNPGIWTLAANGPGENMYLSLKTTDTGGNLGGPFILGSGVLTVNWIINLNTLSAGADTYIFSAGLVDYASMRTGAGTFTDGVYFQYTDTVNGGNWQIKNTSASTTTTANTTVPANTDFVTLSIVVNADATSVAYYINNVQVANSPLTTNIPLVPLTPFLYMQNTAGTNPTFAIDLFWITNQLTNPRPGPTPPSQNGKIGSVVTQVFTTDGTYTPTTGMVYCIAEVVGGGGGGGGAAAAANSSGAGGGGGGGYSRKTISSLTIGASQTVTIGAAGTAGTAGNNAGGTGGTTSLGALLSATGGVGGSGSADGVSFNLGGAGGAGSGGDFNTTGTPGDFGHPIGVPAVGTFVVSGNGGSSFLVEGRWEETPLVRELLPILMAEVEAEALILVLLQLWQVVQVARVLLLLQNIFSREK